MDIDMKLDDGIKKNIPLPRGGELEVEASPRFLEIVKQHFGLPTVLEVNDEHVRMYIWGAFKNAVDKAEAG